MKNRSFRHAILLGATLACSPSALLAQSSNLVQLEEITITATRSPRPVSLTPQEVNIISRTELENRIVQDFDDIFKYETGVAVSGSPRRIGQRPNIRGLSDDRVLQRIDGARLNFDSGHKGQAFLEPAWLQSVEIVRGPSPLFGSGGLGGTVSMRTVEASDFLGEDQGHGMRLNVGFQGANEEFNVSPMAFGKLEGGKIEYTLSYNGRFSGDINTGGDNADLLNSSENLNSGMAKVVYRASENTTLKFTSLNFSDSQTVPPNTSATGPTLVDRDTFQGVNNLQFEHKQPDTFVDLSGNFYYNHMNLREIRNTDGRDEEVDFNTIGLNILNRQEFETLIEGSEVKLTYGMEYFGDEQDGLRNDGAHLFFPDSESDHISGYVQGELSLGDGLINLLPGVRYDDVSIEDSTGAENGDSEVSPQLGAVIKLDRQLNLAEGDYVALAANYSEGFRAPSFGELFTSGAHFPGGVFVANPNLRPETSSNWEVGPRVKYGKASAKFNYFKTRAKDFIDFNVAFVPPAGPLNFTPVNVNTAELDGIEVEGRFDVTESIGLWGNYTRIRGDNLTDNVPLASVSPDRITLGLDYTMAEYGLFTGLRLTHSDKQDRGATLTYEYSLLDWQVAWRPGRARHDFGAWAKRWQVNFGIDNVLDRGYRQHLAGLPDPGINPKASVSYSWTF